MGAAIDVADDGAHAPLTVHGGRLTGIDYTLPVPSAQVKGSILFAGLDADGETVVREALPTRRHSEELLARCGAAMEVDDGALGYAVRLRRSALVPFEVDVPGDPSQAAFIAVAATLVAGSEVRIEHVYTGPGRCGFVDAAAEDGGVDRGRPAGRDDRGPDRAPRRARRDDDRGRRRSPRSSTSSRCSPSRRPSPKG